MATGLLAEARRSSGLSQSALALAAGTSRPTLSAYEHGRKVPSLETATRIARAAGFTVELAPVIAFQDVVTSRNRVIVVPDRLWRLPVNRALAVVTLPLHLAWSHGGASDLGNRNQRARAYEIVLREGGPDDLLNLVDGVLLIDLWPELVLPGDIRAAWQPVIDAELLSRSDIGAS